MSPTPLSKRAARQGRIQHACEEATHHEERRTKAVAQRNALLADSQGPPAEGKFTYSELAEITGLTRTRVAQIIRAVRQRPS